jgi:epoxyqueuosine reductase
MELRHEMGRFYFGCDICQTVCPWNHKHYQKPEAVPSTSLLEDLRLILTSSGKSLERIFAGTPLTRASRFGHLRNAIVVATHRRMLELKPEISSLSKDPRLAPLVEWSLKELEHE